MHAEAAMLPAALETHENAIGNRRPLGVLRVAVHADLHGGSSRTVGEMDAAVALHAPEIRSNRQSERPAASLSILQRKCRSYLVVRLCLQLPQDPQRVRLRHGWWWFPDWSAQGATGGYRGGAKEAAPRSEHKEHAPSGAAAYCRDFSPPLRRALACFIPRAFPISCSALPVAGSDMKFRTLQQCLPTDSSDCCGALIAMV